MDFKKLKGIFVESVEENQPVQPTQNNSDTPKKEEVIQNASASTSNIDNNILESLIKAIESNNLPGEDYLEFTEALKAMKDLPIDETLKIQTVLATLSTKGLTKQKIEESAGYYIKILENERAKFYDTLKSEKDTQVAKKEDDIKRIETENKEKSELLRKITKEIEANTIKINQIKEQINLSKEKINKTENLFMSTYLFMIDKIKDSVNKIKNL